MIKNGYIFTGALETDRWEHHPLHEHVLYLMYIYTCSVIEHHVNIHVQCTQNAESCFSQVTPQGGGRHTVGVLHWPEVSSLSGRFTPQTCLESMCPVLQQCESTLKEGCHRVACALHIHVRFWSGYNLQQEGVTSTCACIYNCFSSFTIPFLYSFIC